MSDVNQAPQWEETPRTEARREEGQNPIIVNYCRVCGRGLTAQEVRPVNGVVYCAEHAASTMQPPPYPPPGAGYGRPMEPPSPYTTAAPVAGAASPGLGFLLGLIPGVGAVYNAQYVKAIVHVVVFGLLISIAANGATGGLEPLFGLLIFIWYLYMPFEAYHTARKRSLGIPVDDLSSIVPIRSQNSGLPVGPIVLIALGVVFTLAQFDLISYSELLRYWPVALIAAGVWMLYERMAVKSKPS